MLHTGGWNEAGNDLGPETLIRANKALELWENSKRDASILITAGSPGHGTNQTMGQITKDWFVKQGVFEDRVLVPGGLRADNTIAETEKAAEYLNGIPYRYQLYVVSSGWHIRRVRAIWKKFAKGINVHFVSAGRNWNGWKSFHLELMGSTAVIMGRTSARYIES